MAIDTKKKEEAPNQQQVIEKTKKRRWFSLDPILAPIIKDKTTREWVEAVIIAVVFALVFRTWLYSPFQVPTGSMIPTIQIGDHLFADMHAYGYVIPFSDEKIFESPVERGDIVIFPFPKDPSVDYIKRAIAVEGDKVKLVGQDVYINGKKEAEMPYYRKKEVPFYDPMAYPVVYDQRRMYVPEEFTIPKGKIWVLGDNRRNSLDGRFWGFVDVKNVKGKGLFIYWSRDSSDGGWDYWDISKYRFERILKPLE